jgi:hypothetical protein
MGATVTHSYFTEDEIVRRARALALELSDKRIEDMADRDGERLAVVETELRHAREEQERMMAAITAMQKDVQQLRDVLTKASGIKLAFMVFIAGFGFMVNQFWHYIDRR